MASLFLKVLTSPDRQKVFRRFGIGGNSWFHWRRSEFVEPRSRKQDRVSDNAHARPYVREKRSLYPESHPQLHRANAVSILPECSALRDITAQLGRVAKTDQHAATIDYMCTVPGVGLLTAIAFRLEVFRPERFRKPEELACFLGLAPGVRQSGESSRGQGIMPSG